MKRRFGPAFAAAFCYYVFISKPAKTVLRDENKTGYLAAVDEGLAGVKAGRAVSYEKVRRWLLSWGSDKEFPPPKPANFL